LTTTVNIVDEDVAVAEVMAALLRTHGFSCRICHSAEEFLTGLNAQSPSISFVSFGLFDHGTKMILEAARQGQLYSTIIMTSDGVDTSQIVDAIKSGAEDVIEKPFSCEDILTIIRRVLSTPMQCVVSHQELPLKIASQLTSEEQQILALMEQGVTIKQIAARLDISIRTVHYRKASILEKTECKNCTEVIAKLSSIRLVGNVPRSHLPQFIPNPLGQTA
jgi:FixJ family two-component response regulator